VSAPGKLQQAMYSEVCMTNSTKHMCCLWFWPIQFIMWKHDVIHKTEGY